MRVVNSFRVVAALLFLLPFSSLLARAQNIQRSQSPSAVGPAAFQKQTYIYKSVEGTPIKADAYWMPHSGKQPVILWLHGGALVFGSREQIPAAQVEKYVRAGFVVVAIDYRLGPEIKLPAVIADMKDAYRWIREKGPGLWGGDANRIAVIGHSAGGYLSLLSGVTFEPRPQAIVSFYGYGDIAAEWYNRPDPYYNTQPKIEKAEADRLRSTSVLTQAEYGQRFKLYKYFRQQGTWTKEIVAIDPHKQPELLTPFCPALTAGPDFPPTLLLHGDKDTDVPFQQSLEMAERLKAQKVNYQLTILPGRGHVFDTSGKGMADPVVEKTFDDAIAFLKKTLGEKK
jgi:acetyl esterase/lipase